MRQKSTQAFLCVYLSFFFFIFSLSLGAQTNSLELIKDQLKTNQSSTGLLDQDIWAIKIKTEYTDVNTGIRHIYAEQRLNGLAVTGTNYSQHISGTNKVDASGLIPLKQHVIKPMSISVSASEAVEILMKKIQYPDIKSLQVKQAAAGIEQLTIFSRHTSSIWDVPCRLVYYKSSRLKTLFPAWEVQMMDVQKKHYWVAYIDAASGSVLEKRDLIVRCDFGHGAATDHPGRSNLNDRVFSLTDTDNGKSVILTGNQLPQNLLTGVANKYKVYDMPFESPIDPGAVHAMVTNTGDPLGSPDGWHKVSNLETHPLSRGNNVWAFQDPSPGPLGGVPSMDPTRTAYANNGLLGAPPLSEPFEFDYPIDLSAEPESYMKAAIVNLFYWNNLMHDVFYHFGFTEDAANFQESPIFSSGTRSARPSALLPDQVLAQAQDGGGTNNANFLTLPDGTNGQMQMYLWTTAAPDLLVHITSSTSGIPPSGKKYTGVQGSFNTVPVNLTNLYTNPVLDKEFVIVQKNALSTVGTSSEGCTTGQQSIGLPPANNVSGKIVLIDRGSCSFAEKVLGAQLGGAAGVIIINNQPGPPQAMGGSDAPGNVILIPAVMISQEDGEILKAQIRADATIIGSLKRDNPPAPKRDGDIDNGVIAHEYGHGISNRLTGGGSSLGPLGGDEQGGEGWSDFVALYMTLRTNDLQTPSAEHPNGILPNRSIGNYVTYQSYDGQGIREFPYSPDMMVNPATFNYIKRSDYAGTHSVGFVWCSMLYEMLQSFIDKYGMSDEVYEGANPVGGIPPAAAKGNNIATRLVIEGMKYQPESPTFVQQRDAILKADTLLYNGQHSCMIWKAFAKRGLGYSAISGTNSLGDESEAFDLPFTCDPTQKRIRIVKSGPAKISKGEEIIYTLSLTNVLPSAVTGVVVSDTLASSLNFASATGSPAVTGNIVTWTLDLAPNETKTITLKALVVSTNTSTIVFGDDHEQGPENWNASTFAGNTWEYRNDQAQAFSGDNFWFTPNVGPGGSNVSLTSKKQMNITANSELAFFHKFSTESNYDGGVVEVSTDNTKWTYLPPTAFVKGNYTGLIPTLDNPLIGLNDLAAFTGASAGYIVSIASLADYAGQNIYIRFRFTSDAQGGSVEGGGWWIDDVFILDNRTEVENMVVARTNVNGVIYDTEGENASSVTSAFIIKANPLPLNLTELTGRVEKKSVALKWGVGNDENVVRYGLERKAENENEFQFIGSVTARKVSAGQQYQYFDEKVQPGEKYLYRVKIISLDNTLSYSNSIYLKIPGNDILTLSIHPNPVMDVANITIKNSSGKMVKLALFNVSGVKVAEFNAGTQDEIRIPLSVKMLSPGTYWLQAKAGNESSTSKMIIGN